MYECSNHVIELYGLYEITHDIDNGRTYGQKNIVSDILRFITGIGFAELMTDNKYKRDLMNFYAMPSAARFRQRNIIKEHWEL